MRRLRCAAMILVLLMLTACGSARRPSLSESDLAAGQENTLVRGTEAVSSEASEKSAGSIRIQTKPKDLVIVQDDESSSNKDTQVDENNESSVSQTVTAKTDEADPKEESRELADETDSSQEKQAPVQEESKTTTDSQEPSEAESQEGSETSKEGDTEQEETDAHTEDESEKEPPSSEEDSEMETETNEDDSSEPDEESESVSEFDIDYWISYAKGLTTEKGLHLDSSATDCWDNPITANASCIYLERDLNARLNRYVSTEDVTDVWIWYEDLGGGQYLIYIGYA